jgi:2,3-dihydroxybiphenyl 1,2-dioxygenase
MGTPIKELGYLGFGVSDLDVWERFGTDVLGFMQVRKDERGLAFRMDDHAQRYFVEKGSDDLAFVGWQVEDRAGLDECARRLRAAGVEVTEGSPELCAAREVKELVSFRDPGGTPVEIFHGPRLTSAPFQSKCVGSRFVAGELGLGHLVISTPSRDQIRDFYLEVLGFGLSDHIQVNLSGYPVDVAFLHVNPRHHSLAMGGPMPKKIHHFLIQVESLDDLGLALDRTVDFGLHVVQGIGRHPNDRMVSFYAETPSGFQFEYGWGGREIDLGDWKPTVYHQISEWGHRFQPRRKPKVAAE